MRDAWLRGGLLAVAVVAAASCTGPADPQDKELQAGRASMGTTSLAVVPASALPSTLGARLEKQCPMKLPPMAEEMLFGKAGAPTAMKRPHRVIAVPKEGARRNFPLKEGRIELASNGKASARLTLGSHANEASVLTSGNGAMTVEVSLRGATTATGVSSDGHVVYPGGHAAADVVQRETGDGAEDWLLFAKAPADARVEYDVSLTRGVAAVRNVGNTVELLDAAGVPRLRMAPPYLVDDDCNVVEAAVSVSGCATDTSPELPIGKVHPSPGSSACRIGVTWPATVKYPIALDPSWSSAASMATGRAFHTGTKLPGSDRVLVIGGIGLPWFNVLSSTEVYDAATDTWASYGSLSMARYSHAVTTFGDGTIMVAGGVTATGALTASAEATNGVGYYARASMPGASAGLTLDPLSADWAIAAGGYRAISGNLRTIADAPVYYKPWNQWYARTLPGGTRAWHSSVATSTGVTFFGGERNDGSYSVLSSVVRYNSGVDTFSTLTAMPVARAKTGAALLSSGAAFVAAGEGASGVALKRTDTAPLPATSPWMQGADTSDGTIRASVTANAGQALVAGGYAGSEVLGSTTRFDAAGAAHVGANLAVPRFAHSATLVAGRVLVAGGVTTSGEATTSAEFLTDTLCNDGPHQAPIETGWGGTPGLHLSSSDEIVHIRNTTDQALSAVVTVRAFGLDGRDSSREVWSGSVPAGTAVQAPFALSAMPVQSVGKKSVAHLYTEITDAPTEYSHLLGVVSRSPGLAYSFDASYGTITTYAGDVHEGSVLHGVASQNDIANRIGQLGVELSSNTGRVWNGSSFDDVGSLGANLLDEATVLGSHVFSDADTDQFDIYPAPTFPWGPDNAGARVCASFVTHFLDDGHGETVVLGDEPGPANTRMEVYEFEASGAGTLLWAGYTNNSGCSPRLAGVVQGRGYVLKVESRLRLPDRNVDVVVRAAPRDGAGNELLGTGGEGFRHVVAARAFSLDTTPFGTNSVRMKFSSPQAFDATLSAGQVLARIGNGIPQDSSFTVMLDRCGGKESKVDTYTACAGTRTLWLGNNAREYEPYHEDPRKTSHNVEWKFVVAHELGHLILDAQGASVPHDYNALTGVTQCKCNHVKAIEDRSHCLQSKETHGGVETESLAHSIAAQTWNLPSASACTFVYYKDVLNGNLSIPALPPPVPVSCATPVKWLETYCAESGTGAEWDWMNWFRSVNVAPASAAISQADLADIVVRACVYASCRVAAPTPAHLVAASRDKYGAGSPQANRFLEDMIANGAQL